jgi:tetratricopeptide (TPR) repeat protein
MSSLGFERTKKGFQMETKTVNRSTAANSVTTDVATRCRTVNELSTRGEYEAARDAFGDLWPGIGKSPEITGLAPTDQAEVLLRIGALSGYLGSSGQVPGAQEYAKDLITRSIRAYEALGNPDKIAEAQNALALCYWREGGMDEARVWFREAIAGAVDPAVRFNILVNATTVEISSNSLNAALSLLEQAAELIDVIDDSAIIGRFHMQRAVVFRRMGGAENIDRALIENTAASVHFEQANHRRFFARVENNIGFLFLELARYAEALEHLDNARATFVEIGDVGTAAQVNETRARVFLAQGRYPEAEKIAFSAAAVLENGGEHALLAEALECQGIAMSRLGRQDSALGILKRAAHIAETAGHVQMSGELFLTILEELKNFLPPTEIGDLYQEADRRIGDQIDAAISTRLRHCARFAVANAGAVKTDTIGTRGSFEEEVHKRESELIRYALDDARGSVTRAARSLGLTHQGLCYIINHRHQQLLTARAPIRVRRKSIIKKR